MKYYNQHLGLWESMQGDRVVVFVANPDGTSCRAYKHRWLWEKANGPIPKGMVLKSLDGNRLNTDPSNWILMTRAALARLTGMYHAYDAAPAEIKPTMLAVARLKNLLPPKHNEGYQSKLSIAVIPEIRAQIASGLKDIEIGRLHGVHRRTIRDIRVGKTWKAA